MPAKGVSEGFAERNKLHGGGWSNLDDDEKLVFSETYFYALANIPKPKFDDIDGEDNDDEAEDVFDEVKFVELKPIYKRLVDEDKVREDFGDVTGQPSKPLMKTALKMIKNVASDVSN